VSHSRRPRFCLVTSVHICNNPRLVKEADALHEAGCDVRVVAVRTDAENAARDAALMRTRGWRLDTLRVARRERESRMRWLAGSVAQAAARRAFDRGVTFSRLRDQAASRFVNHLTRAAAAEPADVVLGHNLAALPAVVRAAERLAARAGFDLEDLHSGVLPDAASADAERRLVSSIETHYLPRCDFLVASSDGIADEVVARYGVARPYVVLNVFPSADRLVAVREDRGSTAPTLYWYSQVIGAGRGLEEAVTALSMLGIPAELHLRGSRDESFVASLEALAARLGVRDRLILHEPASPDALVALAAQHDIGLALEQPTTLNRRLCVTNKLFTYLLGGAAIAATETPGQRAILSAAPGSGFVYPAGIVSELARGLRGLLENPDALRAAKYASLEAALDRFCWERVADEYVGYLVEQCARERAGALLGATERAG
jgi:glycosyltransferase involved in cell wall biosynthesis